MASAGAERLPHFPASLLSQEESDDLHPCPIPEDKAPVSVFLESFSAFGGGTEGPVQAAEVAPDSQPTCQKHAPHRARVAHRAEAATSRTEVVYELSEPLAQVACTIVGTKWTIF